MATLVPEMISVLRDIRDIKYPDIVDKHDVIVAKEALVNPHYTNIDTVGGSIASVNTNATNIANINTNATNIVAIQNASANAISALASKNSADADVVLTHADVVKTNADVVTTTAKALIASQVLTMTANASTLVSGSLASASYNPTTGIMSFGIPTGPKGDKGDAFVINALGTLAGRSAYDLQPINFTYYATDIGEIYFKLSATSGNWSVGSPFGKGDTGDTGNGIASITLTGTVGSVDTYRVLYTDATFFDFNVTNGSVTSVAGRTGDVTLTKTDVGLSNVDNTSDILKPLSTASNDALALKAPLDSPALTNPTINGIAQSGYSGFKNHIINGAFQVNQYANIDTAPVAMVDTTCQIDRYSSYSSAVGATIQRLPKSVIGSKYTNSVKCVATTTEVARFGILQKIELFYNGETKIAGVWVKSNNVNARVVVFDGVTYTSSNAHSGGGGWEFLSISKLLSTSATALNVYVVIASSGLANVSITAGDYIESTMWQLESGTVATPFEQRPIGLELSLCSRYLPYRNGGLAYARHGQGIGISTTSAVIYIPIKAHSRIVPTSVSYIGNLALFNGTSYIAVTGMSINSWDTIDVLVLTVTVASGLTAGSMYQLVSNNDVTAFITVQTEL